MSKKSLADHLTEWEKLAASVEHNARELRAYQEFVGILRIAAEEAREAKQRQLTLRAAAQQASRDLEIALEKARDYEARLHRGVLSAYGVKSEKLIEFGLSPRRPTGRRKKSAQPETAREASETTSPAPRKPSRRRKS